MIKKIGKINYSHFLISINYSDLYISYNTYTYMYTFICTTNTHTHTHTYTHVFIGDRKTWIYTIIKITIYLNYYLRKINIRML